MGKIKYERLRNESLAPVGYIYLINDKLQETGTAYINIEKIKLFQKVNKSNCIRIESRLVVKVRYSKTKYRMPYNYFNFSFLKSNSEIHSKINFKIC